jgi:hypothetical protein
MLSSAAESGDVDDAIDPLGGGPKGGGNIDKMDRTIREASVGVDG